MRVSTSVCVALVSLGFLSVACDNGTPAFHEAIIGNHVSGPGASGEGPGQDVIAEESFAGEPIPVDDSTPVDRGEFDPDAAAVPALTRWTFQASMMAEGSLNYQASQRISSQLVTLDNNVMTTEKTFTQVDRPILTELFSQGSEQRKQSEIFQQNASAQGVLDLLLVIDNSGSMKEEQENLSGKLAPLLSYVKESDWRIGVVTTDPNDGCLRALIQKSDTNAAQAFATAVQPGIKGSGNERGILQAVNGLKGECNPSGSWLRNQSTVGVLIVSDEDNCSAGRDCGMDAHASGRYLTDYLSSIRQTGLNARVYGLIGHPSLSTNQCQTMAAKANIYASVISETSGSWGSICAADYTGTLQAISKDISAILLTQFTLQFQPIVGTVKVFIDGKLQTAGYTVHNNVIEFASAPRAGATVSFEYEFATDAPKAEFVLSNKAVNASVKVYLDGSETTAFTYDQASGAIKFAAAPKAKSIKAVYRRADDLPKAFQLDAGALMARMKVSVNGSVLASSAYSYNTNTGVLTLNTAPSDRSQVVITGDKILAHKLDYPLQLGAIQKTAFDNDTGRSIAAQFQDGRVSFAETDYVPGRRVLVRGVSAESWLIPLDSSVVPESLSVQSAGQKCEGFRFDNGHLDLRSCGFASNASVQVGFLYEKERREAFDLTLLEDINVEMENVKWTVKVNGVERKEFKVAGGRLYLPDLPMQALIEVSMSPAPIM